MSTNTYIPQELDTDWQEILVDIKQFVNEQSVSPEDDPQCTPFVGNDLFGSEPGPNHPSRLWHQTDRPDEWLKNCREATLKQWEGERGEIRKKVMSQWQKDRWQGEKREEMINQAIQNLPKDTSGKNNGWSKEVVYYEKTYYGWNELKRETGVSKHLYRKYYMNGINPEYRIGKNGPEAL
jgi:hypothetical protein